MKNSQILEEVASILACISENARSGAERDAAHALLCLILHHADPSLPPPRSLLGMDQVAEKTLLMLLAIRLVGERQTRLIAGIPHVRLRCPECSSYFWTPPGLCDNPRLICQECTASQPDLGWRSASLLEQKKLLAH